MSIRMAFIRVLAMALPLLLLLANTAWSSPHPSGSARDQYEARGDKLQHAPPPRELVSEATDHHQSPETVPVDAARTRREASAKKKRSYYPWTGSNQVVYSEPYQSIQVWRAPTYQISRPYYIPVYGAPGRIPIYYPPQPLYFNAGQPPHNGRPYRGPTYLPPTKPPTPAPETNMTLDDRFGDKTDRPPQQMFSYSDNEERPIWSDIGFTQGPGAGQRRTSPRPNEIVPTRRPLRPGTTTTPPPLVHSPRNISGGNGGGSGSDSAGRVDGSFAPRTTTRRPQAAQPPPQQIRPEISGGWRPPPSTPPQIDPVLGPTNCVWAIVSCCQATIGDVPYDCFEQRGCSGSFWDGPEGNPCNSAFARAAIASALEYYGNKK